MNEIYINCKKVVYRKTKEGVIVRTPDGVKNFGIEIKAAKEYFRKALIEFKQPYIPKAKRRKKSFGEIMAMTTFMTERTV